MINIPEPERVAFADINPAPYNPRTISDEEMASLKASLVKHGFVLNLVVQRRAGDGTPLVLIGGHQRVRALQELCAEQAQEMPAHTWATVLDINDDTAKQLNVALNKISGTFDPFMLGELWASLEVPMLPTDVLATGFSQEEIDATIAQATQSVDDMAEQLEREAMQLEGIGRIHTLTIDFVDAAQKERVKGQLKSLANGRTLGDTLEELLQKPRNRPKG